MVISFATTIYLINYFDKSDFGSLRLIGSIAFFFSYITSLGIEAVMHRYVVEFIDKKSYKNAWTLFKLGLLLRILSIGIVIVVLITVSSFIYRWFNFPINLQEVFLFILIFASIAPLEGFFGNILNLYIETYKLKIITTLRNIIKLILVVFMVKGNYEFNVIIYIMLTASTFSLIATLLLSINKLKIWHTTSDDEPLPVKEMVKYGANNYFGDDNVVVKTVENNIFSKYL